MSPIEQFRHMAETQKFKTVLADPPWQFQNRTGKMAPEHKRLKRYETMKLDEICSLPVADMLDTTAHLYLWVPNALMPEGIEVLKAWGFAYKTNLIWYKVRKDGGPDGRGVGFYFRNVTEMILFGVKGANARTLQPGRSHDGHAWPALPATGSQIGDAFRLPAGGRPCPGWKAGARSREWLSGDPGRGR